MTISWNPLTQKCEEIDYSPILLTAEQYVSQLRIGSTQWFNTKDTGLFVLVPNSIKWTLVYKADDNSFVKLQRGSEVVKVFAQTFIDQYSYDNAA